MGDRQAGLLLSLVAGDAVRTQFEAGICGYIGPVRRLLIFWSLWLDLRLGF